MGEFVSLNDAHGGPNAQSAHPDAAIVAQKTADSLALRIRGFSYRRIAAELGISKTMAHRYVIAALAEIREQNSESANELRQIELERLDVMQAELTPDATTDPKQTLDPRTADTILRIMERRAKLVGLDTINAPPAANLAGEITVRVKRDDDVLTPDVPPST